MNWFNIIFTKSRLLYYFKPRGEKRQPGNKINHEHIVNFRQQSTNACKVPQYSTVLILMPLRMDMRRLPACVSYTISILMNRFYPSFIPTAEQYDGGLAAWKVVQGPSACGQSRGNKLCLPIKNRSMFLMQISITHKPAVNMLLDQAIPACIEYTATEPPAYCRRQRL